MSGRFRVFFEGECRVDFVGQGGQPVGSLCRIGKVSPLTPLGLAGALAIPEGAHGAVLAIYRGNGSGAMDTAGWIGELARVAL